MLKKITGSFLLAFQNIRSHFFHTLLSILGIVIGVAALVAILSLIDGMKESAVEQMRTTSSLQSVIINHELYRRVNEVSIRKDSIAIITHERLAELRTAAVHPVTIYLWHIQSGEVTVKSDSLRNIAAIIRSTGIEILPEAKALSGRLFSADDMASKSKVAVVNLPFIKQSRLRADAAVGHPLIFQNDTFEILGVLSDTLNKKPHVFLPITLIPSKSFQENPPAIAVEAKAIEDVNTIKQNLMTWVKVTFPENKDDFTISSNDFRVKQAEEAFLLFRIVMGLIVGISVIVGGIGVMNVLLISVTQRTQEIGIRKAVGAKRFDIMLQFISESITVSTFGSVVGLILGVLSTMIIVPLIRLVVKVPFEAAYTWDTFILIGIIAIVIGLVFGTYPAIRASRLDPVEAIRRE
jgi:putative ABC transport system permease protein